MIENQQSATDDRYGPCLYVDIKTEGSYIKVTGCNDTDDRQTWYYTPKGQIKVGNFLPKNTPVKKAVGYVIALSDQSFYFACFILAYLRESSKIFVVHEMHFDRMQFRTQA